MDKGKRRFNGDRKPVRPDNDRSYKARPNNRGNIDDPDELTGPTDKIEGRNAVTEALASGRDFNKIWILKPEGDKTLDHGLIRILDEANKRGIVVTRATRQVLDKMSHTHNHQGVIASVAPHDYADLDEIIAKCRGEGRPALLVALDEIKDAYNLGSILRISDCWPWVYVCLISCFRLLRIIRTKKGR